MDVGSLSNHQRAQRLQEVARGFRYLTTRTDVESESEVQTGMLKLYIRNIVVEEKRMLAGPLRAQLWSVVGL